MNPFNRNARPFVFYEFFAGGGMARAGLGPHWQCVLANDRDAKKGASYAANWNGEQLRVCDVANLKPSDLPPIAIDLAWASPPCQDLSLAGDRAGLDGERSGAFWPFWQLMRGLRAEGRAPRLIVIENVSGLLTSHGGRDFNAIASAIAVCGYRFGAIVIDTASFMPQSRERLFSIAVDADLSIPSRLLTIKPRAPFHSPPLVAVFDPLSDPRFNLARCPLSAPLWSRLPVPPQRNATFADIIEDEPTSVRWHTQVETERLLAMMTPLHLARIEAAQRSGRRVTRMVYRRTRTMKDGGKVSRWEIRNDDIAGCLRTVGGGSSVQSIVVIDGEQVRSRRLTPREYARLQGLDDDYTLPANVSDGYDLIGDGVAVPVVRFLAANVLEPLLSAPSMAPEQFRAIPEH
jgi:DNA (cytosine-5)-methyltransferase 1